MVHPDNGIVFSTKTKERIYYLKGLKLLTPRPLLIFSIYQLLINTHSRIQFRGCENLDYTSLRTSQAVLVVKNPLANANRCKRCRFDPWVGKIPWRKTWQPTPLVSLWHDFRVY